MTAPEEFGADFVLTLEGCPVKKDAGVGFKPGCSCSIIALEPSDDCWVHGWPDTRQCPCCGQFRGQTTACKRCGCTYGLPAPYVPRFNAAGIDNSCEIEPCDCLQGRPKANDPQMCECGHSHFFHRIIIKDLWPTYEYWRKEVAKAQMVGKITYNVAGNHEILGEM